MSLCIKTRYADRVLTHIFANGTQNFVTDNSQMSLSSGPLAKRPERMKYMALKTSLTRLSFRVVIFAKISLKLLSQVVTNNISKLNVS